MPEMEARYKAAFPHLTPAQRKIRLLTAEEYWIPTLRIAEAHVSHGGEAYFYRFDRRLRYGPLKGEVPHGAELRFVWDDAMPHPDPESGGLRESIHAAWMDFIFGRVPALKNAPAWPRFDLTRRPEMLINDQSTVAFDPDSVERHLWDGWPFSQM
jgi:para-nitrobenzyl esterase